MKKTLSLIAVCLLFSGLHAQLYVNGKNLNADSSIRYFEINYDPRPSLFFEPEVDYGSREIWRKHFTDSTGKKLRFNSGVQLLNYITFTGWKLVDRQILTARYDNSGSTVEVKEIRLNLLFQKDR